MKQASSDGRASENLGTFIVFVGSNPTPGSNETLQIFTVLIPILWLDTMATSIFRETLTGLAILLEVESLQLPNWGLAREHSWHSVKSECQT